MPSFRALTVAPIFGLVVLALATGGCDSELSTSRVDTILALPAAGDAGAAPFGTLCGNAICHGANGDEGPATDLSEVVQQRSDAQLVRVIIEGQGQMPAQALSDQEVADVVAYLNETFS